VAPSPAGAHPSAAAPAPSPATPVLMRSTPRPPSARPSGGAERRPWACRGCAARSSKPSPTSHPLQHPSLPACNRRSGTSSHCHALTPCRGAHGALPIWHECPLPSPSRMQCPPAPSAPGRVLSRPPVAPSPCGPWLPQAPVCRAPKPAPRAWCCPSGLDPHAPRPTRLGPAPTPSGFPRGTAQQNVPNTPTPLCALHPAPAPSLPQHQAAANHGAFPQQQMATTVAFAPQHVGAPPPYVGLEQSEPEAAGGAPEPLPCSSRLRGHGGLSPAPFPGPWDGRPGAILLAFWQGCQGCSTRTRPWGQRSMGVDSQGVLLLWLPRHAPEQPRVSGAVATRTADGLAGAVAGRGTGAGAGTGTSAGTGAGAGAWQAQGVGQDGPGQQSSDGRCRRKACALASLLARRRTSKPNNFPE